MREKVLEILKNSEKALDSIEITNTLGFKEVNEITSLLDVLNSLEEEGIIYKTRKDKYMLFENSHLLKGKLSVNKRGYGFVSVEGIIDDFFIEESNLNGALNNDIVIIEELNDTGKKTAARVVKVLRRGNRESGKCI